MKHKIFLLFILLSSPFILFSQNKTENIDLINLNSNRFLSKDISTKLIFGHADYSFDKFLILNKNLAILYDNYTSTFHLVNLNGNSILSQINLYKLKGVTKNEAEEQTFDIKYLLHDINLNYSSFFNLEFNSFPFEKLNDSTIYIGFFNFFETKYGYGTQFNLRFNNNILHPEFIKYNKSVFENLNVNNSEIILTNSFDAASIFIFNKKQYGYFGFLSLFKKDKSNSYNLLSNFVMEVINSKKMNVVSEFDNKSLYLTKHYSNYNNYLIDYFPYYPKADDSIIVRDTDFRITNKISIDNLFINKSTKEYINKIEFYKDDIFYKVIAIKSYEKAPNDSLFFYTLYDTKINNSELELKKLVTIQSNIDIRIGQIFNDRLLFAYRNPLYNTNYLYGITLNDIYNNPYDTLFLNFINYKKINALKYQDLLNKYDKNKFIYDPTNKDLHKAAFDNTKKDAKEYSHHTLSELALSIQKCLDSSNYNYILSNLTAFEDYEYKTFSILIDNKVLNNNMTLYNHDFFNLLQKDISGFINNSDKICFDGFKNINIYKTNNNHFYKFIKIRNNWYICANILTEGNRNEIKERKVFAEKYKYLEYITQNNSVNTEVKAQIFDTIESVSIMPDSLTKKFFHDVKYNPALYPQNKPQELINSLKKAVTDNNFDYKFSQLVIYPIQQIMEMASDPDYKFKYDTSMTNIKKYLNLLDKISKKDCKNSRVNKNIICYTINEDKYIEQIYLILLQKRWYLYSQVMAIIPAGTNY